MLQGLSFFLFIGNRRDTVLGIKMKEQSLRIAGDDFDLVDDVDMDVRVKLGDGSECAFSSRHAKYLKHFLLDGTSPSRSGGSGAAEPASHAAPSSIGSTSSVWLAGAAVGAIATSLASSASSLAGSSRPRGSNPCSQSAVSVSLNCGSRAAAEAVNEFYRTPVSTRGPLLQRMRAAPLQVLQVLELCHRLESTEMFMELAKIFGDIVRTTVEELRAQHAYPPTSTDQLQKCSVMLQKVFGLPEEREPLERLKELVSYFDPKLPMQSALTHSVSPEVFSQMRMQMQQRQSSVVNDDGFAQKVLNLDPFRQRVWQPESEAPICPGNKSSGPCGKIFPTTYNFLWSSVTAEHCRCCGLRKCSTCTSYLVDRSIARVVKPGSNDSENAAQQRRACRDCYFQALELTKYLFLCQTFVFAQLHVPLVSLMRCVNKQWRSAAELCLNEYRNRFYLHATAGSEVSREFREVVRNTAGLMEGHPQLVHMFFLVMDWSIAAEVEQACSLLEKTLFILADRSHRFPPHTHWQLLCTRECAAMSKEPFALQVLLALQRVPSRYILEPSTGEGDSPQAAALVKIHHLLTGALAGLESIHMCTAMTQLLLDVVTVTPCQAVCVPVLYEWVRRFQWIATVLIQEVSCRPRNPTLQWLSTCAENSRVPRADDRLVQSIPTERQAPFITAMKALEAIVGAFSRKPSDAAEAQRTLLRHLIASGLVVGGDSVRNGEPFGQGMVTGVRRFTFFFDSRANADIVGVKLGEVAVASSQVRPVIIPFVDVHGRQRRVMYKAENLRRDFVVCTGAALLQDIIADANPQDRDVRGIPRYRVLPLTNDAGLVEMVEECVTVQEIISLVDQKTEKKPLLGFLMGPIAQNIKRMRQTSSSGSSSSSAAAVTGGASSALTHLQQVSHNFLLSARFFILVNYVFAIGDRHRDNVMVSIRDGSIFHIDFGMIMNTKTLAESLTSQYVRFDQDILECIDAFAVAAASGGGKTAAAAGRTAGPHGAVHQDPLKGAPVAEAAAGPPLTPQQERDDRREKALNEFLASTGEWFISVRPHSSILFLMLAHLVRHGVLAEGAVSSSSAVPGGSAALSSMRLLSGKSAGAVNITSEEHLSRELRSIFIAGSTESEARRIFMDRVSESVGKNWLKDLTYDTRKRAKSMYADISSRLWSYWSPDARNGGDDDEAPSSSNSAAFT